MSQTDLSSRLNEAIAHIQGRQLNEARTILRDLSTQYPYVEAVWLWLSAATEGEERLAALHRVLALNPANEKSRSALVALTGDPASLPPIPVAPPPPPPKERVPLKLDEGTVATIETW
ncbi:MAG TPA: hypothetical protein PLD47_12255, partial [Aggregatilineales bacterium]|nr:hypothetical protein [Aggregatilineales bacterium]